MSILDTPQVSGAYFFPRRDDIDDPHVVDVGEAILHCCKINRDGADVTLLHFHGNGETVGDYVKRGAGDEFAQLNANIVFAE